MINVFNKTQFVFAHKLAKEIESEKQELFLDKENCILVDKNDRNIGFATKRDCHKVNDNEIKLHRAFSVFLFNKNGEMLLQKRSSHKVRSKLLQENPNRNARSFTDDKTRAF